MHTGNLTFNLELAAGYKSQQQKIRVLTESWVSNSTYCPNCGETISKYINNTPGADFFCRNCNEDFELKSKKDKIGLKVVDGAYSTMIERLNSRNTPNLFLLNYELNSFKVKNFIVVPKHFFISEIIEKRKPLPENARRSGWIGCNILLHNIPNAGRIFFIKDGVVKPKNNVLAEWKKTLFLREQTNVSWLLDIMNCIDKLGNREFTLNEIYGFEVELMERHPNNMNIKDKIRQQLQLLRDKNYLTFMGRGKYKKVNI
ncbi:MAG TPA: DpnI domain-containing protein [Melioribacteraceae bacterium]|nr:DpnI domain-containing protein [Melioribacteraceae bacterium]